MDGGLARLDADRGVAGREALRELNVFQVMEMRTIIGFVLLYPLVRRHGGFPAMKTRRPLQHVGRNLIHYAAQLGCSTR